MIFQSTRQLILLFRSLFWLLFLFWFFAKKKKMLIVCAEAPSFQCPLQAVYIGEIVHSEENVTYIAKKHWIMWVNFLVELEFNKKHFLSSI